MITHRLRHINRLGLFMGIAQGECSHRLPDSKTSRALLAGPVEDVMTLVPLSTAVAWTLML